MSDFAKELVRRSDNPNLFQIKGEPTFDILANEIGPAEILIGPEARQPQRWAKQYLQTHKSGAKGYELGDLIEIGSKLDDSLTVIRTIQFFRFN